MDRIEKAKEVRLLLESNLKATRTLIRQDELTDEELLELKDLYPKWTVDTVYNANDIVKYKDGLYKVVKHHTSQITWLPDGVASLYTEIQPDGVIPEFKQPLGAHDAYKKGDKVIFNDYVYESIMDGNTYSPEDYPQGWTRIK